MKVSELIRKLEDFKDEYGDLPVKIYADHGQIHMTAGQVSATYTEDGEYTLVCEVS